MNPLITNTAFFAASPIIVALDFHNTTEAINLVHRLDPEMCKLKVGKELFTIAGPKFIEQLVVSGYDVFLDLKFHDIPNTIYGACRAAANLGVWMINVHASGGMKMLLEAKRAISESSHKPLLTAVTILTSMNEEDLKQIGISDGMDEQIKRLAKLSYQCGLDGVVCSALEAKMIKEVTNKAFLTVTPGIRLVNSLNDDQSRITTPDTAIKNGADYLVIGRPVTASESPKTTLLNILSQLGILQDHHN
ncbi:MAG: orotidine-5-phosphate decarboxylase [Burkholderiales bacterium]|jgi:orotidine-5'-phosphate decarboxylase|nr:orotidine-5-phosphate decarboxylase [Burkholderiales bacterium]